MTRKKAIRQKTAHEEAVMARAASKYLTNAKAASKLLTKAQAYLRRGQSASSAYMRNLYSSDFDALKNVAGCIRAGDLSGAYRRAGDLDTAVRDVIPLDVWIYIGGSGVHE